MQLLRVSSFDEFVQWYLTREFTKGGAAVPASAHDRRSLMFQHHAGKIRGWFALGNWSIVALERTEFEALIFLDSDWTRREQLVIADDENYRLLRRVARNALARRYLETPEAERHCKYYNAIAECHFRLECSSRITICDPDENERCTNPAGSYYLHDGAGRGLAYMLFLLRTNTPYERVEAFWVSHVGAV